MKKVSFLFLLVLAVACSKKENTIEQASKIYTESMQIHDEVMPHIDELYQLKGMLKSWSDSLHIDSTKNSIQINTITESLRELEEADKRMMDWMHNTQEVPDQAPLSQHQHHHVRQDDKSESLTPEEILQIQQDQKAKIMEVKQRMESSLEKARALLKNRPH